MKESKRWMSLLLAGAMVFSTFSTALAAGTEAAAETAPEYSTVLNEDSAPAQGNIQKTGVFYYPSFGGQDYTSPFFYDDNYFTRSAYEYQDSLSTMTLALALSAFGSAEVPNTTEGYKEKSRNLEYLLAECGFPEENYATNQAFREKPTTDSIGVGVSHKTILQDGKPYTLIAAAIRGGGYGSEWASNFTIGRKGSHRGFSEARDQVLDYLKEYIADQDITGNIKLWITGYSRAAATTNMVAGALDGGCSLGGQVSLAGEDLYAYCYECPQGAAPTIDVDAPVYQNIFNIVNPADLVTKLGPTKPARFGFQRYGVNHYLPTALKEGENYEKLQAAMLEHYYALDSTKDYVVDDFQMKEIALDKIINDPVGALKDGIIVDNDDEAWDLNAFLDETMYKFFKNTVHSRGNYVAVYEKDMRELCRVAFGCGDRWDDFEDYFIENLKADSRRITVYLVLHMNRALNRAVEDALEDALSRAGITDYSARQIKQFALKVVGLLLSFAIDSPNLAVTTVENLEIIGSAHLPEVCLAWLQSFDPNFTPQAQAAFNSGIHRVVRVSGPADLAVYDDSGALVAAIADGSAQKIADSSIVAYISQEGEQLVYLPADQGYSVALRPTGTDPVSYSVQEYSEEAGGINRIQNYYDLPALTGGTYTGLIPTLSARDLASAPLNGTGTRYTLTGPDGSLISADESLSGNQAAEADVEVTVTSNDETLGTVTGGTVVKVGGSAKVTALPKENCTFLGWYRDGQLVSTELAYSFCVTEEVALEGRFAGQAEEESWDVDFTWNGDYTACQALFTGTSGKTETLDCTVTSETIPAAAETDGRIIYTASVTFRDQLYTDVQAVVIPALGHNYGAPVFQWNEDHTACTAAVVCADCGKTMTLDCCVTSETTPATEDKDGRTVYTASVAVEGVEYTDQQTVVLPATGADTPEKPCWIEQWLGHLIHRWFPV